MRPVIGGEGQAGSDAGEHGMYGKQTEYAIAAMSRLAEVYDNGVTRLAATEIAASRGLQKPFVAKILTVLSQAGLVKGSPGPGGGYALARPPKEIRIYDVFTLFEREDESDACPFGGGICGVGEPCALHQRLVDIQTTMRSLLHDTTFEVFRKAYQDEGKRPTKAGSAKRGKPRESFRAPKSKSGRSPK